MPTVVITSGYFNPLHPGHIDCFELSKELGDQLWVIVNNDQQAAVKRGKPSFQDEKFRMRVVGSLKPVDKVFLSIDTDQSVCASLERVATLIREAYSDVQLIFTKGGDRFANEIPEMDVCKRCDIALIDGLGEKTHQSRDYMVVDEENE